MRYRIGGNACAGVVRARPYRALGRMMELWDLHRGDSPLVIDVPHSGTHMPDALRARLTAVAQTLPDTDWHVDKLYAFAQDEGATLMSARRIRAMSSTSIAIPSGAALYAGADNTELCPTRTFADEPIYAEGDVPTDAEIASRRDAFFVPYHAALAAELARVRERHGYAVLLDGHSILQRGAALFRRPAARSQSRHGERRELRARAAGLRAARAGGRERLHARRQRPLQGRLDHAPLRAAAATACTRCSSRWRSAATWTRRRPTGGIRTRASRLAGVLRRAGARARRVAADAMIRVYTARQRYDA